MKSMTCKELGGACDVVFDAETFEDLSAQSKSHGQEMAKNNDPAHIEAMNQMMEMMNAGKFSDWFESVKKHFDNL
ncbi:MAG: hypothetical protein RLZZ330_209 [Actinomycetota bacterium]|jgi:hypothetical protein